MKKVLSMICVFILCLSLCACGAKEITLEDISSMYIQADDDSVRVDSAFEDGTMTVKIIEYRKSASSPTGRIAGNTETYTMEYTLEGDGYVTVAGTKYYYEIDEKDKIVSFSVEFMELAKEFYFDYVK